MAIILEVGVNTYITLEEANSILEAVFDNEEWKLLPDEQKKVCLVNAANKINLLAVKGSKLDTEQALIFPRSWETVVSDKVKMAQCYEYTRLMQKPFKLPLKNQVWKIMQTVSSGQTICELILPFARKNLFDYAVRYIKKPSPIVLTDLSSDYPGLSIDGIS